MNVHTVFNVLSHNIIRYTIFITLASTVMDQFYLSEIHNHCSIFRLFKVASMFKIFCLQIYIIT